MCIRDRNSPATGNGSQSLTTFCMNANLMSSQPKAKLPKLALPKFRGEVTQWQNFWDSYNSAIHVNQHLSFQAFASFIGGSGDESHTRPNENRSKLQFSYRDITETFWQAPEHYIKTHG